MRQPGLTSRVVRFSQLNGNTRRVPFSQGSGCYTIKPDEGEEIVSKLSSMVIDSLRPNNSWLRPMRAADPKDRWKYYAIRFGVIILVIGLLSLFRFSPHNTLR
jgi:hypothetical protein